ncbi:E3 ubiquitin-protein ligase tom1 [Cytospora paraplurivora]|uniref:HECT-type E3 ubiquitin transferase n=1 Tax=Cytospora paraplurivora TaxID=2898453 RepID=A0AAN9U7L6_9PEZI
MGKITKTMQPKHRETLSPWLKDFVQTASTVPLPLLPQRLDTFPVARWPLPRGDLYHWIPLLNRFDNILECFNKVYHLHEGPQMRDFDCDLLLGRDVRVEEYGSDEWDTDKLRTLGYTEAGDSQLIKAVLQFTRRLLNHCGNRSIYASSSHLNDLLNSSDLSVIHATLEVGLELAQRYQASVKRMTQPSRQVSNALLANHYNIDLDRVQQIAQPFVKTPIISLTESSTQATPASASKGKDKDKAHSASSKNAATLLANDLGAVISSDQASESRWKGWGDLKIIYYPKTDGGDPVPPVSTDRGNASIPNTPTPLRRSTTMGPQHQTSRNARAAHSSDDTPSPAQPPPAVSSEGAHVSSQKSVEIQQSVVASSPIYDLLKRTPADMPKTSQYEFLNRSRICKALLYGTESRQQALAVRLLAIANLAYIHPEGTFLEQVLKQDNDEPRQYHLVYQLVELIHPSSNGQAAAPRWLQQIALSLLEAVSHYGAKYQDVISALNATVNHGVLLYVIRKAVAEMKEGGGQSDNQSIELDDWRNSLFSLALHLAMNGRVGSDMISAGFMDILVDIVNMRTAVADRLHSMAVSYVDALVLNYPPIAFQAFINVNGLDSIAQLTIDATSSAKSLAESGHGTKTEFYSSVVDYEIPYVQQQTLKWLLKFMHHIMNPSAFTHGGNTDRLLRNLVDNSKLLRSLRAIMENTKSFGSVVWTNSINLLTDFINNDPTSFAAISETGMVKSLLESLTNREISANQGPERKAEDPPSDESEPPFEQSVVLEPDGRPHPPDQETLRAPRGGSLAAGILPSSEAIAVIIPVVNSICLNNEGMKLVASSRVLESFLEVFESPEHVRIMQIDSELAYNIGLQFDELGRHHPALRQTVANAVIDMIARVKFLGTSKAQSSGWGAKLTVTDPDGKVIPADKDLLRKSGITAVSNKGKGVAASPQDVEMVDATGPTDPVPPQSDPSEGPPKAPDSITAYVNALASFLNAYISNTSLRTSLIKGGGIEYLLDIMGLPSLPHDFADSAALGLLQQVVANIVESSPVIGLPSLLHRIEAAIESLEPLLSSNPTASFFRPFVEPGVTLKGDGADTWKTDLVHKVTNGTDVARALLTIQSLLKTLYSCFPYQSRHGSISLPAVNVYDHFHKVIKSLGPLLRVVLQEEISLISLVPQHWTSRKLPNMRSTSTGDLLIGEQETFSQVLGTYGLGSSFEQTDPTRQNRPTAEEQSSSQYQNYQVLKVLLQSIMPSAYSFFQTLGKALMSRRERDNYARARHMQMADALAQTVLDQLEPFVDKPPTKHELQYCIIMLHIVHEMLTDSSRHTERAGLSVIVPVLDAFKEHQGLVVLNKLLNVFANEVTKERQETEDASLARLGSIGMKKILELYSMIVNGKNITDSMQHLNVPSRSSSSRQPEWYPMINQYIVEIRMSVLPTVANLWGSVLIEKASTDVVGKVVDILRTICQGEGEGSAWRRSELSKAAPLFKREKATFPWDVHSGQCTRLAGDYPEDLAREAVYRTLGTDTANEYCRMHQKGLAGQRNPIPPEDAFQVTSPAQNGSVEQTPVSSRSSDLLREAMVVDSPPELEHLIGTTALAEQSNSPGPRDSEAPAEAEPQDSSESSSTPAAAPPAAMASSNQDQESSDRPVISKDDLDAEREKLRKDLIDRCLDVIRAHPDSVFEVSELINVTIDRPDSEDARQDVGETLVNALMSYALDDEEKKSNGRSIAAYAHLLSLMLHGSTRFFKSTIKTLKDNVSEYLSFLKVPPGNSTDELPPWIPHILLIFEMLLADDAQPVEAKWTPPATENDRIEDAVLQAKEPIISEDDRDTLLESVLDILLRIGKNESLAVAVLRVLVILTRNRSVAKSVGDKRNLQRLFVMTKQLSGLGSARLKDSTISGNVMTVLRHIIEDDDTIRQIMRSEIRRYFEQMGHNHRNSRAIDIPTYTRNLAHVALRSPEIFIEITNETVRLAKFQAPSDPTGINIRGVTLTLKDKPTGRSSVTLPKAEPVDPAVQATEGLSNNDIKPSTESHAKEATDVSKSSPIEPKRPVVENPDGVVHFLLCELLNFREVADKESSDVPKEATVPGDASGISSGESSPPNEDQSGENKDKKPSKPSFKAEEHPIFVYRCFLLHCLAEILQSYTRTKMEFINFKRNAQMFANTPVKPRSGVLNYLLNDLLCTSSLTSPQDSVAAKKKAATSEQARQVLVALVAKTNEKPVDRNRDRFDYEEDPDLLFVRKWVLDMILRAYKDASVPSESFDVRYSKLLSLAELMTNMIGEKDRDSTSPRFSDQSTGSRSHMQLKRLMYEKGLLPALTASIADIDLTFPGVKRTIKYILRVLQIMTTTGIQLSQAGLIPSGPQDKDNIEDEIGSVSSLSEVEDEREETPDLYRNSALGMLEGGREDDFDEDSDEDEDEEMYDDEYPDELDYGDEMSQDGEEDVSDDDEELGEMGEIEGIPGDHPVGVEVIMEDDDDDDDDDEDMDEDDELSDDEGDEDDDDVGSEDMDDIEDRIEIVDEEGNPLDDDGEPGWESETDDEDEGDEDDDGHDYEDGVQDLDELADMPNPLHELHELMQEDLADGHRLLADEGFNFGGDRYDDEVEDDDDEEDEQVDVEDDYIYDYPRPGDEIAPQVMPAGLGWDALVVERGPPRPRRSPFPIGPFVIGGPRGADPIGDFRSYFRSRAPGPAANQVDGLNPLLRRGNGGRDASPRPGGSPSLSRLGGLHSFLDSPMNILSDLMANLPPGVAGRAPQLSFHIQGPGGHGVQEFSIPLRAGQYSRDVRAEPRREVYQEPQQAVGFSPATTDQRWLDEARVIFSHTYQERVSRLNNRIWAKLTPYAAEEERKLKAEETERRRKDEEERQKRLEEERKVREAKEAEEKAAREKAEAEERERLAQLAAEAAAQAASETEEHRAQGSGDAEPQPMEGVETAEDAQQTEQQQPGTPQPRVVTTIRGEEVDVTELGIDPEYLAALPDEFREEVIAQTVTTRRTEARAAGAESSAGEQGEVFQEFLDALPEDIRHEIVQQERQERRRAEREAQRRQAAASGQAAVPQEMDAASILATLPDSLREEVLRDQGNEIMDQLPPDMAAEARALFQRTQRDASALFRVRDTARGAAEPVAANDTNKVQRRATVQMLDKAGVATLLRLMFVSQQGSIRGFLFRVLADVCDNRQNRFEVIGSLLQILQFGSTDMEAVERSFSSLSLKAKQPKEKEKDKDKEKEKDKDYKTSQSLKRTFTNISSTGIIQQNSEISPLLVVQQCLDLLVELSSKNPHIPSLFLTEHDGIAVSLKQAHNRKGKSKDLKVHKYAINSLLHLLDRELVMESSAVMQLLVDLLNKVTLPLQALERRRKEAEEEAKKAAEKEQAKEGLAQVEAGVQSAGASLTVPAEAPAEPSTKEAEAPAAESQQPEQKKVRQLQPPFIPPENLKLVVKIFVARECSSKTFQNTISTIKNLSNIPDAKQTFGRELVKQAQLLSKNIVSDLDELLPHIAKAESGTEIQGLALAKFSPGASEQNKLLRVLTALDHLFETKKDDNRDAGDAAAADEKSSLLMTLYHNETFNKMWEKLSACLAAIRQRDHMINVATILLPLIESLMVVCKNTTLEDAPQAKSQLNKDMVLSSPPPEDSMAGLFFTFTNEHRRILNELVRQNNKLMSGTFSLLVKNPKVLEFDNKRSYFTRTVHAKQAGHTRPSYPPLTVNVRRDNVFHDSYRTLAFKSDDEIKYGKLNVRFHGEEGVDAGGVTREWFAVLTRAMFNPDYALFTPVSADRTTFHPNKASHINEEHLHFFKFIGRIIGKAVYEGRLLECYFSRALYKRILGKPVSVKDMESFDPDYYKSLVWMLENDITGAVIETFSVEEEEFGASKTVDLIENGSNIEVTNDNKHEYVRLIVEHKLLSSVKVQMEHFLQGFHGVIPADLIAIFNEQELELLISGLPDIDVDDWKSNTEYHNYTAASQQIQWFWRALRSFDKEERAKLLQFVTGTSKVPLNGFKELEGMNGINRFNIHRDYGNKDRLPSSHTCFNQLDLPEYESYEALRTQLLKAITAGSDYFGFA